MNDELNTFISKEMITLIRDSLLNENEAYQLAKTFINKVVEEERLKKESTEDFIEIFSLALHTYYLDAIKQIFKSSGSPIEKIFLGSLLMCFLAVDPLGIIFVRAHNNEQIAVDQYRKQIAGMLKLEKRFEKRLKPESIIKNDFFLHYVDFLLTEATITAKHGQDLKNEYIFYHVLGYYDAFHITPQAKFPNFKVDNKSFRADLYIYKLNDKKFNLIVECDGYKWHKNKNSFISDRKRDRVFQTNGFEVIRFAGSEIYNTPHEVAHELFDYLHNKSNKKK